MKWKIYRERNLPPIPKVRAGGLSVSVMVEWNDGTHSHEELFLGENPSTDIALKQAIRSHLQDLKRLRPDRRLASPSRQERRKEYRELEADEDTDA